MSGSKVLDLSNYMDGDNCLLRQGKPLGMLYLISPEKFGVYSWIFESGAQEEGRLKVHIWELLV